MDRDEKSSLLQQRKCGFTFFKTYCLWLGFPPLRGHFLSATWGCAVQHCGSSPGNSQQYPTTYCLWIGFPSLRGHFLSATWGCAVQHCGSSPGNSQQYPTTYCLWLGFPPLRGHFLSATWGCTVGSTVGQALGLHCWQHCGSSPGVALCSTVGQALGIVNNIQQQQKEKGQTNNGQ